MKKWEEPDVVSLTIKSTYEVSTTNTEGDVIYTGYQMPDGSIQDVLAKGTNDGSGPKTEIPWNQHNT
ncbi:MAG: hypothetical protein J5783_04485 [Lachnospiraceae bacterium]|nr:hypothetical protein [Lachnospiraceae bacterium]